jgi:outer membrane biosynthesis protein TonB
MATTGTTISVIGHGLILASGLLWFAAKPLDQPRLESLDADVISESEFSQLTTGLQTAPQSKAPQPITDKLGAPSEPVKDPSAKVVDKPEIKTTAEAAPSAAPPKPAEPKPANIPPPPPSPAKAEATPEPDLIAEALKRDEAKKKEEARKLEEAKKREEAKKKEEARKREERKLQEKIETALLDKREPQRMAATGAVINSTPSLGAPGGNAPDLSESEKQRLIAQLMACWFPPEAVLEAKDLVVTVEFALNRDGSLSGEPTVVNRGTTALFQRAAESALSAVRSCQPFRLPPAKYEHWQVVDADFRPEDKVRN